MALAWEHYRKRLPFPPRVIRGCVGKHKHPSKGKAEAHIRALMKVDAPDTDKLDAYFCVRCHSYHVGNRNHEMKYSG